ncbi:isopentenyl-diphosphate delta-isomerase [Thiomicrorhabdus immobilis]|uniref:Isopentenyl-diphosphate delta-isomerase n=1 Tax=Thiomicrorhabdus immobilis TaxID=2791037 RepID=A0ABM7MEP3_9GAMM|nr:type 2 isopentenyl-diphosphate Delta-isomerase [Thiomicrorhabdus immobilis]BCN93907.1 isopentenyl-diphosphate delta-isomerase [Thiomicrorhabdus immobilis]
MSHINSSPLANLAKQVTDRKQDHIDAVLNDPLVERNTQGFENIRLMHRALPECDFANIDTTTTFLGKSIRFPFLIASMTGGASQNLGDINRHLAEAAQACNVPMAVGSQRAMIVDEAAKQSFAIRKFAPDVPLIANLGAVQLNYGFGVDEARRAIDVLQADALYLHLNPLQEVIQPEGDTNFARLAEKIHLLAEQIDVPIILKEVGSGLSPQDIELGLAAGITLFDLAGRGGTSWSRIEAHRSDNDLGILFQDWGLTTVESLRLSEPYQEKAQFIASGGIRNGIDMIKAVIMGGRLCGVAAPLLAPAQESTEQVVARIEQFKQEFQTAQFLLGIKDIDALHLNTALIAPL